MFQCVPNLSEGRRPEVIELVRERLDPIRGMTLADLSCDPDHNRMVVSMLGSADGLRQAVLALYQVALETIDVSVHEGVHPRIGAVDVVPFVPIQNSTMQQAVELARTTAAEVAARFEVPVFLYEEAALRNERKRLPDLRRPGLEERVREPDFGPARIHPRLGASVVGARKPLVAYNIVLNSDDMQAARRIALTIRQPDRVRAIAVWLESRRRAQVSINLISPREIGFWPVYAAVQAQAARENIEIESSELIGLTPLDVLAEAARDALKLETFQLSQILETHL